MRILFVTNNYTPYSGGVVSSINATVNALREQGHHVMLIAPNFLGDAHDDPDWVRRVPSLIRFRYNKKHIAIPWRAKSYLDAVIKEFQPDVVHVHHPFLLGPKAVSIAQKMGIKTIFTYHTMYEAYAHYVPAPRFLTQPFIARLVLQFCKKVNQIIVPSSAIQAHLKSHGITNSVVIPSGLKEQFVALSFLKKNLHEPYQLLYVGRFVKEKNISALLDVMAQLPKEYELTLVGYGQYVDALQDYAYGTLQLARERVRFIIKPDQKTLVDLYCSSDLFLFPSHTDTQGLVLAEALACSLPVIALDGPGQRDSIVKGENGFIVADVQQMAEKIQQVMHDTKLYEQLRNRAWESAHAFNPHSLGEKLIRIYC